jgi:hypothetical protein
MRRARSLHPALSSPACQVAAIEAKYGMSLTASCLEDVKSIYGTFVEAVVPPGDAALSGGEAPLIQVGACGCLWVRAAGRRQLDTSRQQEEAPVAVCGCQDAAELHSRRSCWQRHPLLPLRPATRPVPAGLLPPSAAALLQSFKSALGLTDVDAAPVHMDVGRRILRGRMEAGSRGEDIEVGGCCWALVLGAACVCLCALLSAAEGGS